jgi:hypothetical protein
MCGWPPSDLDAGACEGLQRVLEQYDAMLHRARRAIACWSMAAKRRRMVKDMRVMIAKMAWEEPWQWGEKKTEEEVEDGRSKKRNCGRVVEPKYCKRGGSGYVIVAVRGGAARRARRAAMLSPFPPVFSLPLVPLALPLRTSA